MIPNTFIQTAKAVALVWFSALLLACSAQEPEVVKQGDASDSQPATEEQTDSATPKQPNFLVIVADDLGYLDLSLFGSEIATPNIDALAASGLILSNYYTAPLCAPTRTELLSGTTHHRAGQGMMQVNIIGQPNYEGVMSTRVVSLAQRLKDVGYHTYMAGKWHLGHDDAHSPTGHGFERSFTLLEGGGSHFGDRVGALAGTTASYVEDGVEVDQLPEDFYSTDFYTDKMLSYLHSQEDDEQPFFAYLAYTAPHWPTQAPDEDIAAQKGRYDVGYEEIRQQRFAKWQELGFAAEGAELPNLPENYRAWNSLSDEERAKSARVMEVYAAMVERMDRKIGEIVDYLRESGQLEHTVILFQSDNGAEAGGHRGGFTEGDNSLENIGRPGSWAYIGVEWAEAGSAPFYLSKSFASEGGIRVPAILSGPGIKATADPESAVIMTYDVAPTFLELAGAELDAYTDRPDTVEVTGRSFAALLRPEQALQARGVDDGVGQEHAGHAGLRKGDWKLLWVGNSEFYQGVKMPGPPPMSGVPQQLQRFDRGAPAGTPIGIGGPWKLFNLKSDPAEKHDLAATHLDVLADMLAEWKKFSAENGVIVKSGEGDAGN